MKDKNQNPFPIGLATGAAFCNRAQERADLLNNIDNLRHTVLLGPRRYGKTSLVTEVIQQLNYPYCEMDFLLCGSAEAVQTKILDNVGKMLCHLLPKTAQLKKNMLDLFRKLRPEILMNYHELELAVKLHPPSDKTDSQTTISEVLENLDKAAQQANKRVIVFMDEFQQIGLLRDQHVIEAAIRHAVERSKNVSYIFSGSDRHLLLQMFSDKSRPFYRLCQLYPLKRIAENEHIEFIQKQAKHKWKKFLDAQTIKKIMELSESHAYYVNLICNYFWSRSEFPSAEKIEKMWRDYIKIQKTVFASDVSDLSNNQKIVLKHFARFPVYKPYAKETWSVLQLTPASLKQAIDKLIEKDLLHVDEDGLTCVLDPALKDFINNET